MTNISTETKPNCPLPQVVEKKFNEKNGVIFDDPTICSLAAICHGQCLLPKILVKQNLLNRLLDWLLPIQ